MIDTKITCLWLIYDKCYCFNVRANFAPLIKWYSYWNRNTFMPATWNDFVLKLKTKEHKCWNCPTIEAIVLLIVAVKRIL